MFVVNSLPIAIIFCILTMLGWGSWANTMKLCPGYRFQLFYWDYIVGLLVGIAKGTHRAVKVAIVRHAKHCNDWPPPPNRPVGSPLAQELDGPYRVDHAASLQGPLF